LNNNSGADSAARTIFCKRLIDQRTSVKRRIKTTKGQEADQLEAIQHFLKILANATSYGIFVELNVSELDESETRNRWEEQFYLSLSLDAQIIYGMQSSNPEQLKCVLSAAVNGSGVSQREIAERTGLSRTTIAKIFAGSPVRSAHQLTGRVLKAVQAIIRDRDGAKTKRVSPIMARPGDRLVGQIDWFQLGEKPPKFKTSVDEIQWLEGLFKSGRLRRYGLSVEQIQRRLCKLKGIYFDGYDPPDD
jgi:hypothetical protein